MRSFAVKRDGVRQRGAWALVLIVSPFLCCRKDLVEKGQQILQERSEAMAAAGTLVWDRGGAPGSP